MGPTRSLLEHETIDGAEVERLVDLGSQGRTPAQVFDSNGGNGGAAEKPAPRRRRSASRQ